MVCFWREEKKILKHCGFCFWVFFLKNKWNICPKQNYFNDKVLCGLVPMMWIYRFLNDFMIAIIKTFNENLRWSDTPICRKWAHFNFLKTVNEFHHDIVQLLKPIRGGISGIFIKSLFSRKKNVFFDFYVKTLPRNKITKLHKWAIYPPPRITDRLYGNLMGS